MIGTAYESILARLIKIVDKIVVEFACPFCCLNHNKSHGALLYHTVVAQFLPVNLSLIMAYVNAVYLVAFGIWHIAIQCPPSESERRYEEIVEEKDIERHHYKAAKPPCPSRQFL